MAARPHDLPPSVPRRGNALTRFVGRTVLRLLGWRLEGTFPDLPRFVLVGAPHTSNWDGVAALAASLAYGVESHFLGKREAFRGPMGWLLGALGGIPVDRSGAGGQVDQAIEEFARRPSFILGIAPEGTRGRGTRWRTGFHTIARAAGVPFVLVPFDHARRVTGPGPVVWPTDDLAHDLRVLDAYFAQVEGRNPALYTPPSPEQLGRGDGARAA